MRDSFGLRRLGRGGRRARGGRGRRVPKGAAPALAVGASLDVTDFSFALNGGFKIAGPKDFPEGGFEVDVADGVLVCTISASAPTKGDAGVAKTVAATEGEVFSASALVRIREASVGFKVRLTIAAKLARGRQLQEFNARTTGLSDEFVAIEIGDCVMPPGTQTVAVKLRAHTDAPGDFGTAECARLVFTRVR